MDQMAEWQLVCDADEIEPDAERIDYAEAAAILFAIARRAHVTPADEIVTVILDVEFGVPLFIIAERLGDVFLFVFHLLLPRAVRQHVEHFVILQVV